MTRILPVLFAVFCLAFSAGAAQFQPQTAEKTRPRPFARGTGQITVPPAVKATKPDTSIDYEGEISWHMQVMNAGKADIPGNTMEYRVFQTIPGKPPVLFSKGMIHEALSVNQIHPLTGRFFPCCSADEIRVEIWDKPGGKLLASPTTALSLGPARAAVKVDAVFYKLQQQMINIRLTNAAPNPIRIKMKVFLRKKDELNWVKIADRVVTALAVSNFNVHDSRVAVLDTIRVEISQDAPMICPTGGCVKYQTWEDKLFF